MHVYEENGLKKYRLFTHYGRTDDLISKPESGRRELRFCSSLAHAKNLYASIIAEKTGKKGYRRVDVVASNVGSKKVRRNF